MEDKQSQRIKIFKNMTDRNEKLCASNKKHSKK